MHSLDLDASGSESGSGCISKPILCRGFWLYSLDLDVVPRSGCIHWIWMHLDLNLDLDASPSLYYAEASGCIHWIWMHLDLNLDLDAFTGSGCIWIWIWMHPLDLFASGS